MSIIVRLKMKFKKPKKVELLSVKEESCVGCGKCAKKCKRDVFVMQNKKAVVANFADCVGCGKCVEKMCNFGAIKLVLA